jgi:hypothetical protein
MNPNFLRIARESGDRWWTHPLVLFLAIFVLGAIAFFNWKRGGGEDKWEKILIG